MWYFENNAWSKTIGGDASETGSGPGSYNIYKSVWHVNCCNAELNGGGGWGIFNSILGWENSATYGSVLSYNLYWVAVIVAFLCMRGYEKKGHWPFMKAKAKVIDEASDEGVVDGILVEEKFEDEEAATTATVRELQV